MSAHDDPMGPFDRDDLADLPGECVACNSEAAKAIRFEDPDDLVQYCEVHAAKIQRWDSAVAVISL